MAARAHTPCTAVEAGCHRHRSLGYLSDWIAGEHLRVLLSGAGTVPLPVPLVGIGERGNGVTGCYPGTEGNAWGTGNAHGVWSPSGYGFNSSCGDLSDTYPSRCNSARASTA